MVILLKLLILVYNSLIRDTVKLTLSGRGCSRIFGCALGNVFELDVPSLP